MRESASDQLRTESALRQAIDNGQLEVHYQPEFHLETGDVVGAEALMRWRHPERGLKAASSFVSLAEQSGLIIDHGRWALGQATAQAARWVAEGCDIITRVNVSARQFRGALVGEVQEALAAANLSAGRLCLEFAETTIMDDAEESVQLLEQLNDLGVKIGIDGFGTGFSSLAYLKRLRLDTLKMDRTIVAGVGVDSENTAIVRSIIGLAQSLDLELVAEGIETDAELAEVVQLGCHRGQGFQLGHPVPAEDFGLLLGAADSLE
jgi:EAL domain-containing protein (putative c-di-GMP-specific phosphodiesterase class I)